MRDDRPVVGVHRSPDAERLRLLPLTASRRFVLGTLLGGAVAVKAGELLEDSAAARADPYVGGAVTAGRGVAETVLDVTDDAFAAKGDGVILGDLVTQAGSTALTSATGPFTSTAADRGKLVLWRGSNDTVGSGTISSVQSATRATLAQPASVSSRADGGPNTNGAIGTDNTRALNAAFTAAQAAAARVAAVRHLQVPIVEVHIPRGVFLTRALDPFEQAGVVVAGEGRFSSVLASGDTGAWIQLSRFSRTPSSAFQGTATDWTFRGLQFINPAFQNGSSEGNRTGTAIQDNGSGGTKIHGCMFTGLAYGFCGAYGSDFSQLRESVFSLCDTGYYFGPGSQQLDIAKTDATQCREGAVFEGAPHWHIGNASSFEDPSVAAITIEASASGRTRLGLASDIGGAYYSGKFLVDGATWFETDSGGNGRLSPRLIWVHGDSPFDVPVDGVTIRDAYVVAGGAQVKGGTNSFLEYACSLISDEPAVLEDVVIGGTYLNAVFRMSGSATTAKPRLIGIDRPAGVALTLGPVDGAKIVERDGSARWPLRLAAPGGATTPLRLTATSGQGTAPLLATHSATSDAVLSGFASGGAVIEAFVSETTSGGAVMIDASRCNYCSWTLTGDVSGSTIANAPAAGTQRLTIEFVASGGDRRIRWPPDCRFAHGGAPTEVKSGDRTAVTLTWNPARKAWFETARSSGPAS